MVLIAPMLGFLVSFIAGAVHAAALSGPWDAFNYAPSSRTVYPTAVYKSSGEISPEENLLSGKFRKRESVR